MFYLQVMNWSKVEIIFTQIVVHEAKQTAHISTVNVYSAEINFIITHSQSSHRTVQNT